MERMSHYIGVKEILAVPMTRGKYNVYQGWKLPDDQNGDDTGYLVEYVGSGNPCHKNHKDYISWSPTDVFEAAYKKTNGMTFGLAIEVMKKGFRVCRTGWNGKGIFLGISHPGMHNFMTQAFIYIDTTGLATDNPDAAKCRVPWLASQTDMLADDWEVV